MNNKKPFLFFIIFFLAPFVYSQSVTTANFEQVLKSFFIRSTDTMATNALSSRSLSTYHIGNFPHFALSWAGSIGLNLNDLERINDLPKNFSAVGQDFSYLSILPGLGVAAPASIRVGGGGIPFDMGLQIMYIPVSINDTRINMLNIGLDFRFSVLEEHIRIPGISIGLAYFYQDLYLETRANDFTLNGTTKGNKDIRIRVTNSTTVQKTSVHTLSIPVQISKKLNFFEPSFGIEPFFSASTFSFKTEKGTNVLVSEDGGTTEFRYSSYINNNPSGIINSPLFASTNNSLNYQNSRYDGGIRFFTGFSFVTADTWFFNLEISYEPVRNTIAVMLGNRINF